MTTTASWTGPGIEDAYGAVAYHREIDGITQVVRVFDDHAQFTIRLASAVVVDTGSAKSFDDAAALADTATALFISAGRPATILRQSSPAGTCIPLGRLLTVTDKTLFYLDRGRKRRMKRTPGSRTHLVACSRC